MVRCSCQMDPNGMTWRTGWSKPQLWNPIHHQAKSSCQVICDVVSVTWQSWQRFMIYHDTTSVQLYIVYHILFSQFLLDSTPVLLFVVYTAASWWSNFSDLMGVIREFWSEFLRSDCLLRFLFLKNNNAIIYPIQISKKNWKSHGLLISLNGIWQDPMGSWNSQGLSLV